MFENIPDKKQLLKEEDDKKTDKNKKEMFPLYLYSQIRDKEIYKCICKIEFLRGNQFFSGTGFFCKIPKIDMVCLLTNNHIINEETFELSPKIKLTINDTIKKIIDLSKRRFKYTNKEMDYTVIEILEVDDINDSLEIDDYIIGKDYQNENIYCIEYPLGQIAKLSEGKVIKRSKWHIVHNLATRQGSSGSPLVLKDSHKVIGIHIGKLNSYNLGVFIYDVIEDILKNNKNIEKEKKISKCYYKIIKFLSKNKFCLIGLSFIILLIIVLPIFLYNIIFEKHKHKILYYDNNKIKYNGTMIGDYYDGKGVLYYENGNICYNGEWIQNKKEGIGKFYSENGQKKYDGEWLKDRKDGNGISYYDNGNIEYNGTWTQDKKNFYGLYYYKSGNISYIGEWNLDKFNGKGIGYYENGKITYNGTFLENKKNGYGLYYYESGNISYNGTWDQNTYHGMGILYYENGNIFYIGGWDHSLKSGKGILYYENGIMQFYGTFYQNKYEEGKLYYTNGKIAYEGKLKEDKFEGKGILYFESGNIRYNGTFAKSQYDGYGALYYESGGIKYNGTFTNGEYDKNGIEYYKNGNIFYNGHFALSQMHGYGILYYIDGNICYNGTLSNGLLDGYGTFYLYNHLKKYIGYFEKNRIINGVWYDKEDIPASGTESEILDSLKILINSYNNN